MKRNVRPWLAPTTAMILLVTAAGQSGCAAGSSSAGPAQADPAGHQVGTGHQEDSATRQAVPVRQKVSSTAPVGALAPRGRGVSRDPRQIAHEFAMFYAKLAANEDHPASESQVEALARQLAPSCSAPSYGQYPCVVHLPGRVPSTQHCVAVVGSSGSVTGRCTVGTSPAPVVASGYVDCASVGRVVTVTDASGDEKHVVPLTASTRLVPANDPRADLVEVRVAATPTRFCADFRTLAPISHGSWLTLDVNQNGAPGPQFAPTINYRNSPAPELQSPIDTPVAGRIGTAEDWTSLVITAGDHGASLPDQPFQFRAYANHETSVPGAVRLTTDSVPDVPQYAAYP